MQEGKVKTSKHTDRQTDIKYHDRQTEQTDGQTDTYMNRQPDRPTDNTDRQIHTLTDR